MMQDVRHNGGRSLEDARREACLLRQLRQHHGRAGVLLGGFEHERIAGGNGDGPHPERHHCGEVERADARHDL